MISRNRVNEGLEKVDMSKQSKNKKEFFSSKMIIL
jgi:hypothetical protein